MMGIYFLCDECLLIRSDSGVLVDGEEQQHGHDGDLL